MFGPLAALWRSLTDSHHHDAVDRSRAKFTFEVLPGEGIGPFRLGMERDCAREIAQGDLGSDLKTDKFGINRDRERDNFGDVGIAVIYDENNHAGRVSGEWGWARMGHDSPDSAFMLMGKDITRMTGKEVIQLCETRWTDVIDNHFSIDVPSAGLSFTYWENAALGWLCAVNIGSA